jgi:dihydropyrimidinase
VSERLIVRGGQVVTPSEVVEADILIEGEQIVGIVASGTAVWPGARVIEAGGCYVFPGVVDPHTHIQLDRGFTRPPITGRSARERQRSAESRP